MVDYAEFDPPLLHNHSGNLDRERDSRRDWEGGRGLPTSPGGSGGNSSPEPYLARLAVDGVVDVQHAVFEVVRSRRATTGSMDPDADAAPTTCRTISGSRSAR